MGWLPGDVLNRGSRGVSYQRDSTIGDVWTCLGTLPVSTGQPAPIGVFTIIKNQKKKKKAGRVSIRMAKRVLMKMEDMRIIIITNY